MKFACAGLIIRILLLVFGLHCTFGSKVCHEAGKYIVLDCYINFFKNINLVSIFLLTNSLQGDANFKVRINEKGTRFIEKIKINEQENTVRFTVPKHNSVDKSEVLLEFNLVRCMCKYIVLCIIIQLC